MIPKILEVDIAKPIEEFLSNMGYKVRSEVKGCDITASRDKDFIVVECKVTLSLKLIYQAVDRQEFCDSVYVALPILNGKKIPNRKYLLKLLKRLEIGLITVTFLKSKTRVDVLLEPKTQKKRRKNKKRKRIMTEIAERSGNYNTGGSSVKSKLITAYRESAVEIANLLNTHGSLTAKQLKKLGTGDKTYTILYNNHYGWFFKDIGRGIYGITTTGRESIIEYKKLINI